ncbi:MAG: hypothetical protein KQH79_12720 [Bacteroidetes bacterium]|nr:hypothetical protein [Bacteroidota bacterium]
MKTIIISDIKGKDKSIIPYGLNLAKKLECEVDILHIVDSRSLHGVQSAYSDSQSVTPGKKLSHQEIIEREKKHAEMELDKILSREASMLNYPLKINTFVVEGSIERKIREQIKTDNDTVLLINSEHDNFIFHSKSEILDTIYNLDTATLLVPGDTSFHEFKNVFLLSNPAPRKIKRLKKKMSFLKVFNPVIKAIHVVRAKNYDRLMQKDKILESIRKDRFTPFEFKSITLAGKKFMPTLSGFIEKETPDLIMNLMNRKSIFKRMLQKKRYQNIMNSTKIPFLLLG